MLRHCDISGAGNEGAVIVASSNVTIEHCHIHHNVVGLDIQSSNPTLQGNLIYSNRDFGMRASSSRPTLRNNLFFRNGFGLQNNTPAIVVDARYNAWGHPTGPFHPITNPAGLGDRVSNGVLFYPWLRAFNSGLGQPPTVTFVEPGPNFTFLSLPIQFRLRLEDADEFDQLFLLRAEIWQENTRLAIYDQVESPQGWDRPQYKRVNTSEPITATLTLTQALPNGSYQLRVVAFDSVSMSPVRELSFTVNRTTWGIASVAPEEVLAAPSLTQTIQLWGAGFNQNIEVSLEHRIDADGDGAIETERITPTVRYRSSNLVELDANFHGMSGAWEVVARMGNEERRARLYVIPYMPLFVAVPEPPQLVAPARPLVFRNRIANLGTAPGVAFIAALLPTGVNTNTIAVRGGHLVANTGLTDTVVYTLTLGPGESRVVDIDFRIPGDAVDWFGNDPSKLQIGRPLVFDVSILGQAPLEAWQLIRQDLANETAHRWAMLTFASWAILEGHYQDRFIALARAQPQQARELMMRIGARSPELADVVLIEFATILNIATARALGMENAVPPLDTGNYTFEDFFGGVSGSAAGMMAVEMADASWYQQSFIREAWEFATDLFSPSVWREMFSYEGLELMGYSALKLADSFVSNVSFGLLHIPAIRDRIRQIECRRAGDPYYDMAGRWANVSGAIASFAIPIPVKVKIRVSGADYLMANAMIVANQSLIRAGGFLVNMGAREGLTKMAKAAQNTEVALRTAWARLRGKDPSQVEAVFFQVADPTSNISDVLLFNRLKLTLTGNDMEPVRLGLSIVKMHELLIPTPYNALIRTTQPVELNIIHYGQRKVTKQWIDGTEKIEYYEHIGYGYVNRPVLDPVKKELMKDAWGNYITQAGGHFYDDYYYHPSLGAREIPFSPDIHDLLRGVMVHPDFVQHVRDVWKIQTEYVTPDLISGWKTAALVYGVTRGGQTEHFVQPVGRSGDPKCGGTLSGPLLVAFDPNEIAGQPLPGYIRPEVPLDITIHFENMPTATLEAENVVITMTLSPALDWDSLIPLSASHAFTLGADLDRRLLRWRFENINLPPNTDAVKPAGEGWARFQVRPVISLTSGTVITLYADIIFDENPPIRTNVLTYVIDVNPPITPTLQVVEVAGGTARLRAQSADEHSGVRRIFVEYSSDGGQNWQVAKQIVLPQPRRNLDEVFTVALPSGLQQVRVRIYDQVGNRIFSDTITVRVPFRVMLPLVLRR
ncbi:right-handed parallel beta-helix repeat-containing protein [Thermoflexus sp.]|uniref:DUF7619 domain-containing protein n=1 Tax=Thermoflexus sp. TaxID=1969742 RepID=UPI003A1022F0